MKLELTVSSTICKLVFADRSEAGPVPSLPSVGNWMDRRGSLRPTMR